MRNDVTTSHDDELQQIHNACKAGWMTPAPFVAPHFVGEGMRLALAVQRNPLQLTMLTYEC